ncbi:MAG TPA: TIGR03619 family F420-dependent LLM class oxidoreductase [Acidimicrobiales bacterium]
MASGTGTGTGAALRFGLFGINLDVLGAEPAAAVRVATAAEAAGWESVWTGEHYVLPDPRVPPSPSEPDTPMLDPFVALANIAAHTSTLRLGTGVTVVPVHPPLLLAKQVASLDRVSGGRFLFGVGAGYLAPEFAALGVPLEDRGARMDDHLDAMAAVWAKGGPAAHDGPFVRFAGVRAEPGPMQRPAPPLHVGGHVPAAFRRAVARGHGWYGFALDLDATAACVARLRSAAESVERPAELGELEISVTPHPRLPLDDATVAAFADLGVTRLIVLPPREGRTDPDATLRFVDDVATRLF